MPGMGSRVVKGYGATSGLARVKLASSWLFPAFAPPSNTTVPAPCLGMRTPCPRFPPLTRRGQFLFDFAYLLLQLTLELIGALMLRYFAQHHLQTPQFVFGRCSATVFFFGFEILSSQIGRHRLSLTVRDEA